MFDAEAFTGVAWVRRAQAILQGEGPRGLLRRVSARVCEVERRDILSYDLSDNGLPDVRGPRVPVSFRWAQSDDLDSLAGPEFELPDYVIRRARQWLLDGDRCLIGYVRRQPQTYLWLTTRLRRLPGSRDLRLGRGRAFVYKTFTHASMRGNGLNRGALLHALRFCLESGIDQVYADIEQSNHPSQRAMRGIGFERYSGYSVLWIMGIPLSLVPNDVVSHLSTTSS